MEKYYSEIRIFGNIVGPRPMLTPWPMTQREGWALYGTGAAVMVAGAIFSVWLAAQFMEPTPWRLLPLVIWFLLLRVIVMPLLLDRIKPANVSERVAEGT